MVKQIRLSAKIREKSGSGTNALRKSGYVPAVLYGPSSENENLALKTAEFMKVLEQAGESTLIELDLEDGKKVKALIQDVQLEPIKRRPIHADLYQVDMKKEVTTEIPFVFVGDAPAVKELGAFVVKSMDEIEVTCLPGDLVSSIEVDLSALKTLDDMITVKDIRFPKGMAPTADPDEAIATVTMPKQEEGPVAAESAPATGDAEQKEGGESKK